MILDGHVDMCHIDGSQPVSSPLWACVKRSRLVSGPPSPSTKVAAAFTFNSIFKVSVTFEIVCGHVPETQSLAVEQATAAGKTTF